MENFIKSPQLKYIFLFLSLVFLSLIGAMDGQHEVGQVIACGFVAGASLLCFVKLVIAEKEKEK